MISRTVKIQLLIFAIITLVGVSFAGARYAKLDRLVVDRSYSVTVHLAVSGGIYEGAEVDWRGVQVGRVGQMELVGDGVDVRLDIENVHDQIPRDLVAVVANRSAVGEQYVDLRPHVDSGPYLVEGSEIERAATRTPLPTEVFLENASKTVESVNQESLTTTLREIGDAFGGAGDDLQSIIDASTSFIETADENFGLTKALIQDSNTVLSGQLASKSSITSFAKNMELFTGTLAGKDKDLRQLIVSGTAGSRQLQKFLEDNDVNLSELLSRSVTVGDIVYQRLPGLKHILVVYPFVVEAGFTVLQKDAKAGTYDAHFGLILTPAPLCEYNTTKRPPQDGSNRDLNTSAQCTAPATRANPRGVQNLPRVGPGVAEEAGVIGTFDPANQEFTWGLPD